MTWTIPDPASQEVGVLVLFLGYAMLSLYLTTRWRRR